MSRCPPWYGKQITIKQREAKVEDRKDLRWMIEDREREEEAIEDRRYGGCTDKRLWVEH